MRDIDRLVNHIAEGSTHIADRGKIWPDDQVLQPREPNGLLPVSEPQPSTDIKNQMVMQDNWVAGALPAQEMVPNCAADEQRDQSADMPDSPFAAIMSVKKTKRADRKNPEEQPVTAAAVLEEVASEEAGLPENRVIRKRFAAKTISVHVSALPPEFRTLGTLKRADSDDYLRKHEIPDRVRVTTTDGSEKLLTQEEVWQLADAQAAQIESGLAKGWLKWATEGASLGQGPYADYLRPTLDFGAFYRDSIKAHDAKLKAMIYKGLKLGPSIIAYDTVSAAAMTTGGYVARGADMTDSSVLTDIATTATYEGASALAAAKLGTIAGGKVFAYTVALPIPGARIVGLAAGFAVGATTAIFAKKSINLGKDKAVELGHEALEAGGAAPKPEWPSRE